MIPAIPHLLRFHSPSSRALWLLFSLGTALACSDPEVDPAGGKEGETPGDGGTPDGAGSGGRVAPSPGEGDGPSGGTGGGSGGGASESAGGLGGMGGGAALNAQCSVVIPASESSFVELCAIEGEVQHVRIDGLLAPATHATTQVLFGFDAAPTGSPTELEADQFQALFYGGGTPAPGPVVQGNFGGFSTSLETGVEFVHSESTVCMDVHDGSTDSAPLFVIWLDGHNGANCDDWQSLTLESAAHTELTFTGASGAIDKSAPLFFRQTAAQAATVTVSGATALMSSQH